MCLPSATFSRLDTGVKWTKWLLPLLSYLLEMIPPALRIRL